MPVIVLGCQEYPFGHKHLQADGADVDCALCMWFLAAGVAHGHFVGHSWVVMLVL